MGYVDQNLEAGEVVRYRTKLHRAILVLPTIAVVFAGIPGLTMTIAAISSKEMEYASRVAIAGVCVFAICGIALGVVILRRATSEFAVTSKRVIIKVGAVSTKTFELFLNKIESVGVDQDLFGRMFGYGTIVIRGTGGGLERFVCIVDPLEFRKRVQLEVGQSTPAGSQQQCGAACEPTVAATSATAAAPTAAVPAAPPQKRPIVRCAKCGRATPAGSCVYCGTATVGGVRN